MSAMDYVPAKVLVKQASSTYGPLNIGIDSSSNYALAVFRRPEYIDYSMTRGGLRSWLSVVLFIMLVSAFSSILSGRQGETDEDTATTSIPDLADIEEEDLQTAEFDRTGREMRTEEYDIDEEEQLLARLRLKVMERAKLMEDHGPKVEEERVDQGTLLEVAKIRRKARKKLKELHKDEPDVGDIEKMAYVETEEDRARKESSTEKVLEAATQPERRKYEYVQKEGKTRTRRVSIDESLATKLDGETRKFTRIVRVFKTEGRAEQSPAKLPAFPVTSETRQRTNISRKTISDREKAIRFFRTKAKDEEPVRKIVEEKPKEKPKIEVKMHRRKGKALSEQVALMQELNQPNNPNNNNPNHNKPNKPKIQIKCHKTKGKSDAEFRAQMSVSKNMAKDVDYCEVESCESISKESTLKPEIPQKAISEITPDFSKRLDVSNKGKQMSKVENDLTLIKPIKVFRTKGKSIVNNVSFTTFNPIMAETLENSKKSRLMATKSWRVDDSESVESKRLINRADDLLKQGKLEEAIIEFDRLIDKYPTNIRAHYGKADAFDQLAESKKSNKILEQCIEEYKLILALEDVPDDVYQVVATRLIDRLRFRGWIKQAMNLQEILMKKFPQDTMYEIDYGLSFLILGSFDEAKQILSSVLMREPNNGYASVLYGYILKTTENKLAESVAFLRKGIESGEKGTQDARFYYHLGDALQGLNREDEAYEIYDKGVKGGLFPSKFQRSIYNVAGLRAKPWWTLSDTNQERHLKQIEKQWQAIRDESLILLDKIKHTIGNRDEWTEFDGLMSFVLFAKGQKLPAHCSKVPMTCELLENFSVASSCQRCRASFLHMRTGIRTRPHCGSTNCRLRAILTLSSGPQLILRVGQQQKITKRGKFLVFDDSFEHEMQIGKSEKTEGANVLPNFWLALQVDFWHPDLTEGQKRTLTSI